jgi:ATP-dependent Clp protease protease subunit
MSTWRDGPTLWNEWARLALLEQRTVFLTGMIDDDVVARVSSELMLLDASDDAPITLRIDNATGCHEHALTLIDVLDLLGVPVHAICHGRVEGAALAVLAVCDHREAGSHATFVLREPASAFEGAARDVEAWIAARARTRAQLWARLSNATRCSVADLEALAESRRALDVAAAAARGFVDEARAPEARVIRIPRRVGYRAE